MYKRVTSIIQGTFKNGRLAGAASRSCTSLMAATVTNNEVRWTRNANTWVLAPYTSDKTTVRIEMGIDGDATITVDRDGSTIYSVVVGPEHPSALEHDVKEIDIIVAP